MSTDKPDVAVHPPVRPFPGLERTRITLERSLWPTRWRITVTIERYSDYHHKFGDNRDWQMIDSTWVHGMTVAAAKRRARRWLANREKRAARGRVIALTEADLKPDRPTVGGYRSGAGPIHPPPAHLCHSELDGIEGLDSTEERRP